MGEIRVTKGAVEEIILYYEEISRFPKTLMSLIDDRQKAIDDLLNDIENGIITGDDVKITLDQIARCEKLTPEELWEKTKTDMREMGWEVSGLEKEDFE